MAHTCTFTFDPDAHDRSSVTTPWSCPHDQHSESDRCVFHLRPAERQTHGISDEAITDVLVQKLTEGAAEERAFIGATIPALSLDYMDIEGETQHPADLRHTEIPGGISASFARFEELLDLRHSTIGGFSAPNATFEDGLCCTDVTVTGPVDLFEILVTGDDITFTDTVFEDTVRVDEANFTDDVNFDRTRFEASATFLGTEFHGTSNAIGDNTTFDDATFVEPVDFTHATFEHATFRTVECEGTATFANASVTGAMLFDGTTFHEAVTFDEVVFTEDVSFETVHFDGVASFRGSEFHGGANLLQDDVSFRNVTFGTDAIFEHAQFSYASFEQATFAGTATFELARFDDNLIFDDAQFQAEADFDEIQVDGDARFETTSFMGPAVFRGAEFHGGTNHLEDDVVFSGATFGDDADFKNVLFITATFTDTTFEGSVDFTDAVFKNTLTFAAISVGSDTYVNFTRAHLAGGTLTQPERGWVRFDLTEATLGNVTLSATDPADERELLDYVRFCDTTFDGFDFSNHTSYLDRNDYQLHTFDGGSADYEFAIEMTPAIIERTYLKAKNNASNDGNITAAGEFRVKRQQHAREKFLSIARDSSESVRARVQNALRATENFFLGLTCGYGLRLYRIATVFVVLPLFAGFLFAFGGAPFETGADQLSSVTALGTADGLNTLALNIYFSYITFLTIGYGNIGPVGLLARATASVLVYLNVVLAGLFLYALIKRSEV